MLAVVSPLYSVYAPQLGGDGGGGDGGGEGGGGDGGGGEGCALLSVTSKSNLSHTSCKTVCIVIAAAPCGGIRSGRRANTRH